MWTFQPSYIINTLTVLELGIGFIGHNILTYMKTTGMQDLQSMVRLVAAQLLFVRSTPSIANLLQGDIL